MKIKELLFNEMTMQTGSMENQLAVFLETITADEKNYKHIGDIEQISVLKKKDVYLLKLENDPIGFFQVIDSNDTADLQNAYVAPSFRKTGIFTKFLWFLKRNEGYKRIRIGDVHSVDTIDAVKSLSKRFNTYWENEKGKQEPYDVATIDKFYSPKGTTGWKVVLENNYDFSDWPKFFEPPNIKCIYEGIL